MKKKIFFNPSLFLLLAVNVTTIYLALSQNWNLMDILWIYWFQSVVIGFYNFIRIFTLDPKKFEGFRYKNQLKKPTRLTLRFLALFFAFHYGSFHLGYAVSLLLTSLMGPLSLFPVKFSLNPSYILISSLFFFANHSFSFFYNNSKEKDRKYTLTRLMFFPYLRILPMQIIIPLGFLTGPVDIPNKILFFLTLKTLADLGMHAVEHKKC